MIYGQTFNISGIVSLLSAQITDHNNIFCPPPPLNLSPDQCAGRVGGGGRGGGGGGEDDAAGDGRGDN